MAGCPARKSRSTCNCPILRCRSSITFCASSAGALLPRANNSPARFTSSCFQLLIIVGLTPNSADSCARVFSPDSDAIATRALNSALCCFLFMPTSLVLWTGQPLAYPAVQESGAAAGQSRPLSGCPWCRCSAGNHIGKRKERAANACISTIGNSHRKNQEDHFREEKNQ